MHENKMNFDMREFVEVYNQQYTSKLRFLRYHMFRKLLIKSSKLSGTSEDAS